MTAMPNDDYAERIRNLPLEKQVSFLVDGTRSLHDFAVQKICPVITTQLERSPFEKAAAATYERMCLLMEGLAILNDPRHFQMAAMATRSVFELLLDLKMLCSDPALGDKFFDFVQIDKFRKAERLSEFLAKNPTVDTKPHQAAVAFANDPARGQRLEQLCRQHWGTTKKGKPRWRRSISNMESRQNRGARRPCHQQRSMFEV